MYCCKDFYKMSVLSLYEGELLGNVNKLYFDKSLKKLIELEVLSEDGLRLSLVSKNIYHVGKNAITIKNNQSLSLTDGANSLTPCPIGSKAYSIKGTYLGIVQEITLTDKFVVEKFSLDNNQIIDSKMLASCGKNAVIFYDENKRTDLKKFVPQKSPQELKVDLNVKTETMPIESPHVEPVGQEKPKTIDFLIGRVCLKDIYNFNNELLIKAHSVVNKKNLKEVDKFGKLRELMLFSK